MLAATTWAQVEPFVRDIIATRCIEMTRRQIEEHQRTLAYFGDWVVQTGMVNLDDCLTPDVIDVYRSDRAHEVLPVMAERERKMLRALAGIAPSVERRDVSTASEPQRPYSDAELAVFHTWASHQRTPRQQVGCMAVFGLAAGCGLTSSEILAVRDTDLLVVHGAPAVRVERDGRVVPVVDRWGHCLQRVMESAPAGLLVAPAASDRRGAMRTVLDGSKGEAKPSPARLRVTWLVAHLEAGTPVTALLQASGMTSIDSLRRALSHVRPMSADRAFAALRMTGAVR